MTLIQNRNRSPTKSAHPQKQMEALITYCTEDYQHQVLSQKENQLKTNNFIRLVASGILLSFVVIKPFNSVGEWGWRLASIPTFDPTGIEKNFSQLNEDKGFNRTFKQGDKILQWEITSPFGDRVHPVTGEIKKHTGVDVSTPIGTPIYAVGRPRNAFDIGKMFDDEIIRVECQDREGVTAGGTTAIATSSLMPEHRFHYYHLDTCNEGGFASGAIIGTTGNSGTSTTGAHLHFGVEFKGQFIDPPSGFLRWTLEGKQPQQTETKPIVEKLRNAIAGQESNHDPSAVNPHSNALGYGQVMPENIKEWSTQCLGKPLTEDEFIKSKEKQVKIIDCKLTEYLESTKNAPDFDTQIRKVASMWYSGDPTLYDNPRPQTYGAGDYPSIREYTTTVLERFKKQ
jgi:hypothetical protein